MAELTKDIAKRRIERYLKTLDQGLRMSKSIRDKGLYGADFIVDLSELLAEHGLLLDGEEL